MSTWRLLNTETAWHWLIVDSDTGVVPIGKSVVFFNSFKDILPISISNNNIVFSFERKDILTNFLLNKTEFSGRKIILGTFLNRNSKVIKFIERKLARKFNIDSGVAKFIFSKKFVYANDKNKTKLVIMNRRIE